MAKAYCSIGMLRSLLASIALLSPVLMADSSSAQTGTPAPNPVPPVLAQVPGSLTPAPRTLPSVPEQPIDRQPDKPLPENVLPTLPRPDELLPNPQNPGLPDESGNDQVKVKVTRFEILGSTVFTAAELAQITQPFVGQELTFAELLQVRSAITKLYVDKGYVTSGALIPPQTLKDGVVKIQIIEGSLEEINVTGNRRLKSRYISSRVKLGTKAPLNVPKLLQQLQLLQLDPLIETISADLQAGTRPGTSLLQVGVKEADSFSTTLTLNNGRSPSVGTFRRQIEVSEANLLGWGDGLSIGYSNTNGSNGFDLRYSLPVNPRNGTVKLGFSSTTSNVLEEPFDVLDIKSTSRYYEMTFRQPLFQSLTQEFAMGLTFARQESQTELGIDDIGPFPLSPGADNEGRTKVSSLRFFQEYTQRSSKHVLAMRSQFNFGLDWFGATVNENAPDSRFLSWRGQGQWVRLLAPDTLLLVRGDLQLTGDKLLPLEQFGLGGQESVRGYRQDSLLTDNGLLFSAEVRIPVFKAPRIDGVLQVAPFFDLGSAWNNEADNPDPSLLMGVGLGVIWRQGKNFSARFDWGIPLRSIEGEKRSLQEQGLYFSLNYTLF